MTLDTGLKEETSNLREMDTDGRSWPSRNQTLLYPKEKPLCLPLNPTASRQSRPGRGERVRELGKRPHSQAARTSPGCTLPGPCYRLAFYFHYWGEMSKKSTVLRYKQTLFSPATQLERAVSYHPQLKRPAAFRRQGGLLPSSPPWKCGSNLLEL